MKKILYIITKSNFGGAQRYVYDLTTNLNELEHTSRVNKVQPCNDDPRWVPVVALGGDGLLVRMLEEKKVRIIKIVGLERDIHIWKEVSVLWQLFQIIRRERPDVVHVNSSKIGGLGSLAARLYRLQFVIFNFLKTKNHKLKTVPRIVFTVHGWPFNETRFQFPFAHFLLKLFSWLTCVFATDVIVLAKHEFEQGLALPFLSRREFHLIPNGIIPFDLYSRGAAQEQIATRLGERANFLVDKIVLGTISELHQVKGLDFLIEGLEKLQKEKKLERVACVIIGSGDLEQNLKEQVRRAHLEQVVFFTGFIPDAKKYLRAFDIFTLTSRKEGLPYVIMEAGLASLPVIASDVGGIPDLIGAPGGSTSVNTEVEPPGGILTGVGDVHAIARALSMLIVSAERRVQFGQTLQKKIELEFSFEQMLAKTVALYQK